MLDPSQGTATSRVSKRGNSPGPPTCDASDQRAKGFIAFAVLLTAVFSKPLIALAVHAATSDVHSHVLVVPFVSAYLLYVGRGRLPRNYASSARWAIVPALLGLTGLAVAWHWIPIAATLSHNDYLALIALSLVCFLAAGGFLFLGRKWMVAASFPVAFLIFMVPLPDRVVDYLETVSKLASAEAANFFFNLAGTPMIRDGVVFQLPGITIHVAQECSGIRSSLVLFITSLLAAHLFLRNTWRKIVLVGLVIPLGILRNGFRILVIGLLCVHFGPEMLHSVIHTHGGPLFFALSLVPLFFLLWWLRKGDGADGIARKRQDFGDRQNEPG